MGYHCWNESAYLVWTGNDLWKFPFPKPFPVDYRLHQGGMVGAQIDEDVGNAGLVAFWRLFI